MDYGAGHKHKDYTIDEAKELQKNPPAIQMTPSPMGLPPTPGMQYMVEHAE